MPTLKTPLVGSYNNRSFAAVSGKDQFVKGAVVSRVVNHQTNTATYYVEKRTGLTTSQTPASGQTGAGVYASPSTNRVMTAFTTGGVLSLFETNGAATVNCGVLSPSGSVPYITFTETFINGVVYTLITTASVLTAGIGWFLAQDASANLTFTGTTHSNTTMDGIASTAGMYAGQAVSGSGIPANTRIASVDSAIAITLTIAATTSTTATFTREAVAKIIDADFPADICGGFAELDGYVAIMTYSGKVYASDLNSVMSWSATNYLLCSKYSDVGRGLVRYRSQILAFSAQSLEFLFNAGNPSGSPFSSSDAAVGAVYIAPLNGISCVIANGIAYWMGQDTNIYTLQGSSPTKVNSQGVDLSITSLSTVSITSFAYKKKTYLNIAYTGPGVMWYCIDDDTWSDPNFGSVLAYTSFNLATNYFVLSNTSGKYFNLTYLPISSSFLDNGSAFTMSIQIGTDMGTNERKIGRAMRLIGDVQASGTLTVSYTDEGQSSPTTLGTMDLTSVATMKLTRIGSWKGTRMWTFEHSANTPFRAKQLEIDYEVAA